MGDEKPLLETIMTMNATSVGNSELDDRTLMAARFAALAAVGAPPASYLMNIAVAAEAGITMEDARGVLVAVAPIIGTPKTIEAAGNMGSALGFALDLEEALGNDTVTL